ncbi:MAG: radical SAM protein, partial [candidate division Zixibacteria bacterium]|nr:radical SAM protein [candidate division Zixibacteria bacterium]
CEHCYQSKDGGPDLNEDLMIQTACGSQNMGVAMFDIEGGEPFMRFPRLLKLVQALDERSEIWVNTAGAGLKPEMLEQLKKAGLFGLMISIHSPDPGKNDAFTGIPGSFEIACNALKLCRQMNLVGAVNSVLSEDEIRNNGLKKLMDLTRDLNSDFVQLIHPKPAGLWMGKTKNMQRDSELIQNIRKEHLHYNSGLSDYPALATQVFEESETALGCTAGGVDRFYVNAYGEIQPCEFLNLSFGNVKDEPLQRIFDRMRSYFSVPASDWLCCTQAKAIHELFQQHELKQTPLPWPITKTLVEKWDRGKPTQLYKTLRIYP